MGKKGEEPKKKKRRRAATATSESMNAVRAAFMDLGDESGKGKEGDET